MRDGEERDMLNIWVVLRSIRDDMVNIMITLPPPNAQPTTQVCNENADQRINGQVVRDTPVASVVRREHDLMPEEAQETRGRSIAAATEEEDEESEESGIAKDFLAVLGKSAVVEAFILHSLVQDLELESDVLLGVPIKGRVFG